MQNQHRTLNPIKILGIYEADELEHGQQAILLICITIPSHQRIYYWLLLLNCLISPLLLFVKERVKQEFGECSSKEC